jgi:3-hydroxy-9,10-secoandrosta-1,3,5(10)-triene-9,17-dione monooxygenase reductase component
MASACATASDPARSAGAAIDAAAFRHALGHFCSGVVIVTAAGPEGLAGFTCQSFFSLSLSPPLIAFSPAISSTSYPRIRSAGAFCINILAEDQAELCARFSRSGTDKWSETGWRQGDTGSPVLDGVLSAIECRIVDERETGDHYLVIGEVVRLHTQGGRPLLCFSGATARIAGDCPTS